MKTIFNKLLVLLLVYFFQTNAVAHTATELFKAVKDNNKREINIALSQCYCPSDYGDGIHCGYDSDGRCECLDENGDTFYFDEEEGGDSMSNMDSNKADISTLDEQGRTILHIAAIYGYTEIIKIILKHDVDVNARDDQGNTSLHYAAWYGQAKMVEKLLEAGAVSSIKNKKGETPLDIASKYNRHDIFALLSISRGTDDEKIMGMTD